MRTLALFLIGIVFGGGIGFVTAAGLGVTFDGHDHSDPAHHGGMDHSAAHDTLLEVDPANPPSLQVALTPDPMSGYNLHVTVQNFTFAPEQASLANVAGQGHAHVYVNGVKQGRLYSAWAHFGTLPQGSVTVEVTLNANNHQSLALNGTAIKASTTLEVE